MNVEEIPLVFFRNGHLVFLRNSHLWLTALGGSCSCLTKHEGRVPLRRGLPPRRPQRLSGRPLTLGETRAPTPPASAAAVAVWPAAFAAAVVAAQPVASAAQPIVSAAAVAVRPSTAVAARPVSAAAARPGAAAAAGGMGWRGGTQEGWDGEVGRRRDGMERWDAGGMGWRGGTYGTSGEGRM